MTGLDMPTLNLNSTSTSEASLVNAPGLGQQQRARNGDDHNLDLEAHSKNGVTVTDTQDATATENYSVRSGEEADTSSRTTINFITRGGPDLHPPSSPIPSNSPAAIQKRMLKVFNVEYAKAVMAQEPKVFTKTTMKLYGFIGIAFLSSSLNGYDAVVMGGINAMKQYQDYFNMKTLGSITGLIFLTYVLGNIVGSLISGPICDSWGRRWGMFAGAVVILLATTIQATSTSIALFIMGRFILGMGSAISATSGPTYIAEVAHPAWRGVLTGLYNSFGFSGAIMASWIMWKTEGIEGSMSWRLPIWMQATTAGLIFFLALLCPETPRWLISNGRNEEAVNVITKYFGEGDRKAPIVVLTYKEMVQEIILEGSDKRWWDYSDLWNRPSGRWRMVCVAGMAFFSQWSGNGAVNHYLPPLLDRLGITNADFQLFNLAVFYSLCSIMAILGAFCIDRLGRRPVLIGGTALFVVWWTVIAILTSFCTAPHSDSQPTTTITTNKPRFQRGSLATISFIYLFGFTHSFAYTPLQVLYPVECLRYESRAKGMAVYNLIVHIALIFNTYGMATIIEKLGWAFCFIFIGWDIVELVAIWFFAVETKGRTLEELNSVFDAKWPPAKSLEKHVLEERWGGVFRGQELGDGGWGSGDGEIGNGITARETHELTLRSGVAGEAGPGVLGK